MSDKDKKLLMVASAAIVLVVGIFVVRTMDNGDSSPLPVAQSPAPAGQVDAGDSDTEADSSADSSRRSRRGTRRMSDADQTEDRLAKDESEVEEGSDEQGSAKRSSVRRPKRPSRRGGRVEDDQAEEEKQTKKRAAPMGAVDL